MCHRASGYLHGKLMRKRKIFKAKYVLALWQKRQIMSQHYYKNCFEFVDPLKECQEPPGILRSPSPFTPNTRHS